MHKKINRMLVTLLTSFFLLNTFNTTAVAYMPDGFNALDLFLEYDNKPYYHNNDHLYYAQKGAKGSTGRRYRTAGQRITVNVKDGNNWITLGSDTWTVGAGNLFHANSVTQGSTVYDMWGIHMDGIRRYVQPNSHYWNGSYDIEIVMDSRYVYTYNGVDQCTNTHGWHTSGSDFRKSHSGFSDQHEIDMDSGLNKKHFISSDKQPKPDPDYVRTDLWAQHGRNLYDGGDVMWMQPGRVELRTWTYDLYPTWAGAEIQDKGSIKGSAIKVNGNDVNISRETDKTKGNFYWEKYDSTAEKNTDRISHFGMQYPDRNENYYGTEYNSDRGHNTAWGGTVMVMDTIDGGEYSFQTDNYNAQHKWATPGSWHYKFTGKQIGKNYDILKVDGAYPTTRKLVDNKFDVELTVNGTDQLTITAKDVYDAGVGIKLINVALFPEGVSGNEAQWFTMNRVNGTNNYSVVVDLNNYKFSNHYGIINAHVYTKDHLDNQGSDVYSINRSDVTPTLDYIGLVDYEHKDSDGVHWVKGGDPFRVIVKSYVSSKFNGVFPTLNYAYWLKDYTEHNKGNELSMKGDSRNNSTALISNWRNDFALHGNSTHGKYTSNNRNYLESSFQLKSINEKHHGAVYPLWGWSQTIYGGKEFDQATFVPSDIRMGIDTQAPKVSFNKIGRNTIELTLTDVHSGLYLADIVYANSFNSSDLNNHRFRGDYTLNGKGPSKITVDLGNNERAYVVYNDRVGNRAYLDISSMTKVEASINTSVIESGGKKVLQANAMARILQNPVPGFNSTFTLHGAGAGVPNPITTGNPMNTNMLVQDTYNTTDSPRITHNDTIVNSSLDWQDLDDIDKSYNFRITSTLSNMPSDRDYLEASKNDVIFKSGFKNYKVRIVQIGNEDFVAIPDKFIKEEFVTKSEYSMNNLETGRYRVAVTMYDFNGNPSGTGTLEFNHIKPEFYLEVTAVKDIDWEKEKYPLAYDTSKFPLGSKHKFNGNNIAVGYAVNYNIDMRRLNQATGIDVKYRFIDSNNRPVTLSVDGTSLETLDIREKTNYTKQSFDLSKVDSNRKAYFKHFIPANADATINGNPHRGDVTVLADVDIKYPHGTLKKTFELYTVTMDESALDDLGVDKQR